MATPPLPQETRNLVWEYNQQGYTHHEIIKLMRKHHGITISEGSVYNCKNERPIDISYQAPGIKSDKKRGSLNWEEWSYKIEEMQALKHRSSFSQDHAFIELGDGKHPVALCGFSDQHMGSWGCNYTELRKLTREIIDTPNLYIGALGDEGQYAIKLRSVLEVSDNAIPPEMQTKFISSWWDSIWKKVAFATWDNHGVQRQENQAGESSLKQIKSKRVVYFNGMGNVDIKVGKQIYKGCVSHQFRGRSMLNPCHAVQRHMRFEGIDREWGMMGDSHTPGLSMYTDGDKTRIAINAGSLQTNSGYAKRYFSLTTHPVYPLIVFDPFVHRMTPFWSVKDWLATQK